jgi:RNA polymerase sigma factor (TIGR02999 family)
MGPPPDREKDITGLLMQASEGNKAALDELMAVVYDELHRMAVNYMRHERPAHTLQPTALVNEAYLRLVNQRQVKWQNRAHFFALAAEMMRRILVNHAEARRAAKRGGDVQRVPYDEATIQIEEFPVDLLALDAALTKLASFDPGKTRIIELRFFGGLTTNEIAEVLGSSTATVERQWSVARAWLYREMSAA